uniref:Cytochrome P450 n=1 Tax=Tetradesmus obliquus TaxID=3088 RepID=A0A383W0T4_TETOB
MRRATLDVIGRAGFGHDFGALQMAQQQQQQQGQQVDVAKHLLQLFDDIMGTSMLLALNPPLPDALVPGYGRYAAAVDALEAVALRLLQERRQQGISPQDRSLLSFMLAAQQAAPGGLVSDKHIRDQLMTFMLAGSDTSAVSLAYCLYELARRPQAQQAVRRELQQVLGDTPTADDLHAGRQRHLSSEPGAFCLYELARRPQAQQAVRRELQQVLGDTPTEQLQPEAFASLPYLTGCINESLRLYPAVPGVARIAQQDAVLGRHLIPQGTPVMANFYSCHRNPEFWARPSEWL